MMTSRQLLAPVALVTALSTGCVTVSETNRKQFNVVPDGQMNSMGKQAYAEMKQKEKISANKALTDEMVEIAKNVARASGKDYAWEYTLFESKEANAFCLPGGKIGVYTGLIPVAQTNAGLATVLGHEIAHATAKHGAERVSQQLVVSGALLAADVAMQDPGKKQMIMAGLGLGAQFGVMLPYGRKQESEADEIGLKYMARAGYDPREAVALWERMAALGGNPPELLSTHPDPKNRAKAIQAELKEAMPIYEASQKVPTKKL